MRVKRKAKPSDNKREKTTKPHRLNLLPYLTAASFAKVLLECAKLLIDLVKDR